MFSERSTPIYRQSQRVILENQQGGYVACPNMPDYSFSWFRDGAFIAYAMTLDSIKHGITHPSGIDAQRDSAGQFHAWCVQMISQRREALERSIARAERGEPVVIADTLNARYTIGGSVGPEDWPEFQLDGPGLWLWSLAKFVEVTELSPLPVLWHETIDLTARYLAAMWQTPCYDCWEERGSDVHISTLAAIYTGLTAAERLLPDTDYTEIRQAIKDFILTKGLTPSGELAKSVGLDMVDANLLLAALPEGGMLAPDDPLMQRTIARIERDLLAEGFGVYRHVEDTYYGGGPWVLLGLWLAWHYSLTGQTERAAELVKWAEQAADAESNLPEQVNQVLLAPEFYDHWVEIRGPIANPLLWTHAKYLIVTHALQKVPTSQTPKSNVISA
jgi:GH15 family glucan-1,4-alpha-glucosidase